MFGARTAHPAAYAGEAVCTALNNELPSAVDAPGPTLFATLVLFFWLMYMHPELGVGYWALLSFCRRAFLNLFKSYAGLMMP